ncbi:MAG: histidine kinase dimerization/phospho-acceptor domain-containing protein, partial [Acidimicrobiales bacterium]
AAVLTKAFDAAERLFGAQGGFFVLPEASGWRVSHYRGLTAADLRTASRHPDFRGFVASNHLRVEPPTHPVVAGLVRGAETAVSVPLVAAGRRMGFLVLLLGEAPDQAAQALVCAFANQLAMVLRSVDLDRRTRDQEQRLATVVHASPNPTLVFDEAGRFVLVNGAAAELFHVAEAFAVGQAVAGRLGHEALENLVASGEEGQLDVALGTPPDRLYRAGCRRVRSAGGRSLGWVLVLVDVTTEVETEKIKSDFVAVIGHELRTPLTVVKGYVRMLAKRGGTLDDEARGKVVAALEANTGRLERLIDDLLFVSSIATDQPTLNLQATDVATVLDRFAGHRVRVVRSGPPLSVTLDPGKLDQIVRHLVDNALKYSDGEVVIGVVDAGSVVEVSVEDSGPGIFSGDLPRLFDRFH